MNSRIGSTWKRATSKRVSKPELKSALLSQPDVLRDLIHQYRAKPATKYDFANDPAGEFVWCNASHKYVKDFPLTLRLPKSPTIDDIKPVVIEICQQFKDLIENNSLHDLLYDANNKPKKESASQKLFFAIAHGYCKSNNLDLSPEPNSGRGPVDFKISQGFKGRILIETKLSTSQQLIHGYETQILEYQKAEKTDCAIYLVIDVNGGSPYRIKRLKKLIEKNAQNEIKSPQVIFVNARPKVSASKYKIEN